MSFPTITLAINFPPKRNWHQYPTLSQNTLIPTRNSHCPQSEFSYTIAQRFELLYNVRLEFDRVRKDLLWEMLHQFALHVSFEGNPRFILLDQNNAIRQSPRDFVFMDDSPGIVLESRSLNRITLHGHAGSNNSNSCKASTKWQLLSPGLSKFPPDKWLFLRIRRDRGRKISGIVQSFLHRQNYHNENAGIASLSALCDTPIDWIGFWGVILNSVSRDIKAENIPNVIQICQRR